MLSYCGPHGNLSEPWVHDGLAPCFLETVTYSVLAGLLLLFGTAQMVMYRRYSTPLEIHLLPQSCLYRLQVFLILLVTIQGPTRVLLQCFVIQHGAVYIYQILVAVLSAVMWPMSLRLLWLERHRLLPSIPARGHGLILLMFWTLAFATENMAFISWFSPLWWFNKRTPFNNIELGLWIGRYVCTCLLFGIAFHAPGIQRSRYNLSPGDEEQVQGLLTEGSTESPSSATSNPSTWTDVGRKLRMLWPFLWPQKSVLLQGCVFCCMLLLVAGRVVNLYTPIYYKLIVDSLTLTSNSNNQTVMLTSGGTLHAGRFAFRWDYVLIYIALRFLQGGGAGGSIAALNNLRALLWIWVQQYTNRETGVELYQHLHGLSLRWHLSRKTGEVLRVMDRGTNSINSLLNYIVFQILPTIADIIVALIYFVTSFNPWFALIMFITMGLYLVATIVVTEWRTKYRREMNKLDNERNAKGVDSLLNFETVKYYGAEQFEVGRYRQAIVDYQKAEWVSNLSLVILNMIQNFIITGGLTAGSLLCVYFVSQGMHGLTVGDFVLFATYIIQLYTPLNWFGTYYSVITVLLGDECDDRS